MNRTVYVFTDNLENFYRILLPAVDRKVVTTDIPIVSNFYNPTTFRMNNVLSFRLNIDTNHPESSFLLLKLNEYSLQEAV